MENTTVNTTENTTENALDEMTLFILDSLSTKDDDNKVIGFDIERLDKIINELKDTQKQLKEESKEIEKKKKESEKLEKSVIGKTYYDSLEVGDEFEVMMNNEITLVRKIETKSKSGLTASCELVVSKGGKTDKRYPKFDKVIIPKSFELSLNDSDSDNDSKEEIA